MDPGWLALIGIFALAGIFALWNVLHRRSIERRLEARGFQPCDTEAPALERAWRALTRDDGSQELWLLRCRRRIGSRGTLYHFTVCERPTEKPGLDDTAPATSTHPAYLFDVPNPQSVSRGAVSLCVLPPGSTLLRSLLAGLIDVAESRAHRLDVGNHPWSPSIVAAHGVAAGRLDDLVPAAVQQKLARATEHGFFNIYIGDGKAGFMALPNHRDVDRQLAYLSEWV